MITRWFCRSSSVSFLFRSAAVAAMTRTEHRSYRQGLGCLALLGFTGVSLTEPVESQGHTQRIEQDWSVLSLEQRRRLFFKYEKRIREMSAQDKVFQYFASQRDELGQAYMLPGDMLRSVVPVYPPEGSNFVRSGSLEGERQPSIPSEDSEFFKMFDINGDGRISFDEYLLFTTLVSIPTEDLQVAFKILDSDASDTVDAKEFGQLLQTLHKLGGHPADTNRPVACMNEEERAGLLVRFFGKDGQHQLTLDEFRSFIAALKDELVRLEFVYYDFNQQGHITGRDFAHTIVGCASYKSIDEHLKKVNHLPKELADKQINIKEFKSFRQILCSEKQLLLALEFIQRTNGIVTEKDFQWVAENVLHTEVSEAQVAIVYCLFPGKEDQDLNLNGLHKVFSRHVAAGLNRMYNYEHQEPSKTFLNCIQECFTHR